MNEEIGRELWGAVAFGAIAWAVLWMAARKGFFRYPDSEPWKVKIHLLHVLGAFAVYFGVSLFVAPFLAASFRELFYPNPTARDAVGFLSWIQLIISLTIAFFLAVFWKASKLPIWRKQPSGDPKKDIEIGALAWVISFPLVLAASQALDVLVYAFFGVSILPDQAAVNFLKMTFEYPLFLSLAAISIICLAPFIEEVIFRGFLQTYARQYLGPNGAVAVSSFCFSFFHYTPEQGLGNIPIIGSLFILALFLGFVYERQGSLLASIALHASFNAISVLNLYCLGGIPRGPL